MEEKFRGILSLVEGKVLEKPMLDSLSHFLNQATLEKGNVNISIEKLTNIIKRAFEDGKADNEYNFGQKPINYAESVINKL